jgi:hypothetical protein
MLIPLLASTLFLHSLVQITARDRAIQTATLLLATMYSRNGLDDEAEMEGFHERLRAEPDGCIRPIDSLEITVCEDAIRGLTPREARLYIFRQLAEPIYDSGTAGMTDLAADAETERVMAQGLGILSFFTRQTHQSLQRVLAVLAIACAALFLPLVFFSYRWGRLGAPGCAIVAAGLPGSLLFGFFAFVFHPPASTTSEPGMSELLGNLASGLLPPLAEAAVRSYAIVIALGALLILAALIGAAAARAGRKPDPQSLTA